MIDYERFDIGLVADYDTLGERLAELLPQARHQDLIKQLKTRIGTRCDLVVLEHPYRDYDASSVFALFYAKKHVPPSRDCLRLHFWWSSTTGERQYGGFCVVRDSRVNSRGRVVLDASLAIEEPHAYVLRARMEANLLGQRLECPAFPTMGQDTDIAVCAHVAVWSILNYYGHRYPEYCRRSIGALAEQVPRGLGRKVPSEGLNLLQISELLAENGFFPLILRKQVGGERDFFRALFSYMESGIPMVAAMTKRGHAVALMGHGPVDDAALASACGWAFHSDFIPSLVVVDDNHLPYTSMTCGSSGRYRFDDLDYVIIPLYEKMYLNASIVHRLVLTLLDSGTMDVPQPAVVRVYLTSTRSLKRRARETLEMAPRLRQVLLKLELPRFVWCADIAAPADYVRRLTHARILIDATAGTYERDPWLLWHDRKQLRYRDRTGTYRAECAITPYGLYRNNLNEVQRR